MTRGRLLWLSSVACGLALAGPSFLSLAVAQPVEPPLVGKKQPKAPELSAKQLPAGATADSASTAVAGDQAPRALLRQAIDLYLQGAYRQAAEILRPLVEQKQLADLADHREALRIFAISLYLSGGTAGAERAFRDLLRLDPGAQLDPAFVRPEVVRFFEQVRQQYQRELNQVVRERGPQGPAVANLLPPWGQFQNNHPTKGYLVLTGEVLFSTASIASAALLYSWQGSTREFVGHEDAYQPLRITNLVAFGLLAAVVAYGVLDGLYYYYNPPPADHSALGARNLRPVPDAAGAWIRF